MAVVADPQGAVLTLLETRGGDPADRFAEPGDWHRERTVGPVAADNISPAVWVLARGVKFSSHHDAQVAFRDSMRILSATFRRRSRTGDIIGPAHRVDVITALKAMTIWPAFQHFEEDRRAQSDIGRLEATLSGQSAGVDEGLLHCEELPFLGNPVGQCGSSPRGTKSPRDRIAPRGRTELIFHSRTFYGRRRRRSLRQTLTTRTASRSLR